MTKDHKPYITGKERGKWCSILGDLKPNSLQISALVGGKPVFFR